MRILYLHQYFATPDMPFPGRSYEISRRLMAKGHQVRMITSSVGLPPRFQPSSNRKVEVDIDGISAVVLPVPYSNAMSFSKRIGAFFHFALLASIEAMRHPADVIFATSTPLTIAIPGILARVWQRIPMVFEVRDLWPELPIAVRALRNPLIISLARALEWLAYHTSAHVVALSPGMAAGIRKRGMPADRITVIPNSCDVELFDVPASRGQAIRRRLPDLGEHHPLIVYTGAFGKINGVGYLVDVAAVMRSIAPEIRFLLVGNGAMKEKITTQAQACGVLDTNLWIWDPIPRIEMPDLLAAATVATSLFVPLKPMWNNSANKFFDALAAGKPIAINYGGWQADLLQKSSAGIVLPGDDPARAAQLLSSFVRDSQQLQRAAAASRTLANTEFHRDIMARKLEIILRKAADGR